MTVEKSATAETVLEALTQIATDLGLEVADWITILVLNSFSMKW